jgi:hypothetical protein
MDPIPSNPTNASPTDPNVSDPAVSTEDTAPTLTPGVVPETESPVAPEQPAVAEQPQVVQEIPAVPVTPEVAPVSDATPPPQAVAADSTPPFTPLGEPTNTSAVSAVDPGHGFGIASLILSIIGLHLVGLILGIVGLNKSKKAGHTNNLALAGIILGGLGFVLAILFAIFFIPTLLLMYQ